MAGKLEGKVAFITGAARGQGRSHAVKLAEEGADIIAVDICRKIDTVPYDGPTEEDLAETARMVEQLDRRIVTAVADVRELGALQQAVDDGVAQLGRLDIVSGNAGIVSYDATVDMSEETWREMIDINLTGVWNTCKAAIPHLIEGGRGGSIVLTSSMAGLKGMANIGHYAAAKHGVVGLMKTLAQELGEHNIRVNSLHPTQVDTPMIQHEDQYKLFRPDLESPGYEDFKEGSSATQLLPIPWVEVADISSALLFLVSDEGRYITGATLPIDGGAVVK